ncbi:MAG: hypothetical protein HYR96_13115 [Deltaproteobacteria bacterium]|nr:hypothetical protein [Deltaproteobacteria bacterium]MBI3293936.1 hypothetical protein [Deltaproteobacteria bacterium]
MKLLLSALFVCAAAIGEPGWFESHYNQGGGEFAAEVDSKRSDILEKYKADECYTFISRCPQSFGDCTSKPIRGGYRGTCECAWASQEQWRVIYLTSSGEKKDITYWKPGQGGRKSASHDATSLGTVELNSRLYAFAKFQAGRDLTEINSHLCKYYKIE